MLTIPFRIDCKINDVTILADLSIKIAEKLGLGFSFPEFFHGIVADGWVDLVVRVFGLAGLEDIGLFQETGPLILAKS